jgi:hypothetical protein
LERLEDRRVLATITGNAFEDFDLDGVRDFGEPGLDGVDVELSTGEQQTTVGGGYSFPNLATGTFEVSVPTPPPDFTVTSISCEVQTDPTSAACGSQTSDSVSVTLSDASAEVTVNFFFFRFPFVEVSTTDETIDGNVSSIIDLRANPGSDGEVSLPEAIQAANNSANQEFPQGSGQLVRDRIHFDIVPDPTQSPPQRIQVTSELPAIDDSVVINGFTQLGASPNSNRLGPSSTDRSSNAEMRVILDGSLLSGPGVNGLTLDTGSDGSRVQGLVIQQFPDNGIRVESSNNEIEGNYIGTDETGSTDLGNGTNGGSASSGVNVQGGTGNIIGGDEPIRRNIISGNPVGVTLATSDNSVIGNFIGISASGNVDLGNTFDGVFLSVNSVTGNVIGGPFDESRNIISGNNVGVEVGASGTTIQGNLVGTNADGDQNIGNNEGVQFNSGASGGAVLDNTIRFNRVGVQLRENASNSARVQGNRIFSNTELGIDLLEVFATEGVTPNDVDDSDTGPNGLQNFPVITRVVPSLDTRIEGTLNSLPNRSYEIEFFANSAADASGNGEGERPLGVRPVTTDGTGAASFNVQFSSAATSIGEFVTATATDVTTCTTDPATCFTSEFSAAFEIVTRPASISGIKFFDTDQSNSFNTGDSLLAGWEIRAYADDGAGSSTDAADGMLSRAEIDAGSAASAVTAADGSYTLTVAPGEYVLVEVLQSGFTNTFPTLPPQVTPAGTLSEDGLVLSESGYGESVASDDVVTDRNFGNFSANRTATIEGIKWEDINGDGVQDPMEQPLSGWTIRLTDQDGNPVVDASGAVVQDVVTVSDGSYIFSNLVPNGETFTDTGSPITGPDSYVVSEVIQSGFEQTFPANFFEHGFGIDTGSNNRLAFIGGIATGDIDRDGFQDIVVANDFSDPVSRESDVKVLFNNSQSPGRIFDPTAINLPAMARPQSVELVNMDNDSDLDLLVTSIGDPSRPSPGTNEVLAIINNSNGSRAFGAPSTLFDCRAPMVDAETIMLDEARSTAEIDALRCDGPVHATAGDFTGNGSPNVISANFRSDNLSLQFDDGSVGHLFIGLDPLDVEAADLNNDGIDDLVIAHLDGFVDVVLSGGPFGFFLADSLDIGQNGPTDVALADLNADSILDIAATSRQGDRVLLFDGSGGGAFNRTPRILRTDIEPVSIAIGNVNGLGNEDRPDLLVTNESGMVSVFLNVGNGDFQPGPSFTPSRPPSLSSFAVLSPEQVRLADLNNDQLLDAVVANSIGGISVHLNHAGHHTLQLGIGQTTSDRNFGNRQTGAPPPMLDFGDAPSPYPVTLAEDGARHTVVPGYQLDNQSPLSNSDVDAEPDGIHSNGTADDNAGSHDEDTIDPGVAQFGITAGTTISIPILASLPPGQTGFVQVFLDFFSDGDWDDLGDQVISDLPVTSSGMVNLDIPIPASALTGETYLRIRFGPEMGLGPRGASAAGEVEDINVVIRPPETDFGDAPSGYPVTLAEDGARHTIVSDFFLGASVDGEADGVHSANADADDLADSDDEDGTTSSLVFTSGATTTISVSGSVPTGQSGFVQAFVDLNLDLDWDDPGEQVVTDMLVSSSGSDTADIPIPAGTPAVTTYVRVRFGPEMGLGPRGTSAGGEVEDYEVTIVAAPVPPDAMDDLATTIQDTSTIDVLLNDTVGSNGPLTIMSAGPTALMGSSVSINPGDLTVNYMRPSGLSQSTQDSFSYTAKDAAGNTSTALVTVDIVIPSPEGEANPLNPHDVNGDDAVSSLDVLLIINRLNNSASGEAASAFFYDVSGDQRVSPLDALLIINLLSANVIAEGESPVVRGTQVVDPDSDLFDAGAFVEVTGGRRNQEVMSPRVSARPEPVDIHEVAWDFHLVPQSRRIRPEAADAVFRNGSLTDGQEENEELSSLLDMLVEELGEA